MLVVDTSGSMISCTTPPTSYPTECNQNAAGYQLNSCGMVPNRINDAKCALRKTVQSFAGEVNFGLSTFAPFLTSCPSGACQSSCGTPTGASCSFDTYGCTFNVPPGGDGCGNNPACSGGPGPSAPNYAENNWLNGGNLVVGINPDPVSGTPPATNVNEILKWFDGQCGDNKELFAGGVTPIGGALMSAAQYLRAGWTRWSETNYCPNPSYTWATPVSSSDRVCRNLNVILVTDGIDNCPYNPVTIAGDLFTNGVTLGGKNWKVRTHVINFAGGSTTQTNAIAAAGGTTTSLTANNEATLSVALSNIISSAIQPEVCNNSDDNCNGCTDEGYKHYCNLRTDCCNWSSQAQRDSCLAQFQASITPANPTGDVTKLPCTSATQQTQPANWLCYDPGEQCNNADDNCNSQTDEGFNKCGNPLHCPMPETCNGQDDDCDNIIDNASGSRRSLQRLSGQLSAKRGDLRWL